MLPITRWEARIIKTRPWITGLVLVAAAVILIIHLSGNSMEFSRYNTGWNGTSAFFFDLDRHHTIEVSELKNLDGQPRNTTLLIIAPGRHPAAEELAAYRAFLNGGNTIVLADDFGTGDEILAGIGSRISIRPGNLSSLDRRYSDPYSVVAYRATDNGPLRVPADIALNRPAPLDGGAPLMQTSVMSWSDNNGDHRMSAGESMGTFPVIAAESRGGGQIVVISDPSIFINSMYSSPENGNNRELIREITMHGDRVLIDQMNSRTADVSGLSEIFHLIKNTMTIEIFIICLLMLCVAGAWMRKLM